jgi:hypothetical protein
VSLLALVLVVWFEMVHLTAAIVQSFGVAKVFKDNVRDVSELLCSLSQPIALLVLACECIMM